MDSSTHVLSPGTSTVKTGRFKLDAVNAQYRRHIEQCSFFMDFTWHSVWGVQLTTQLRYTMRGFG